MARLWLERAQADLAGARVLLYAMDPDTPPWLVAFHAQQAAEKAIKALLTLSSIQPPQSHSLVALKAMLPRGTDLGVSDERLTELTDYAVAVRYVPELSQLQDPTWTDAEAAVAAARAILDVATAQIRGN